MWRALNPNLPDDVRLALVQRLMAARRAVSRDRNDPDALARARTEVDSVKRALGERGPVWWDDGAPDLNRTLVKNSPYLAWWQALSR